MKAPRIVATDLWFPEGPIWMPDGNLLVVEIRRGTLTRIEPDGHKEIVAAPGGGPNGAAIGPDGACYLCNNGGFRWTQSASGRMVVSGQAEDYRGGRIERVDLRTGQVDVLYDAIEGRAIRGPNDLVFDHHGGFWFTDPGKNRPRDLDHGSVCYAKADGSFIREVIFPISKPNGIGLSPDGKTLYVAETETARLWAWDVVAPGELKLPPASPSTHHHLGRLVYASPVYQRFDSLKVQADGRICVGTLARGGITVCNPDGSGAEFVPIPGDTQVTNLAFGGPTLTKAYVTLSWAGQLVELDWPSPGLALAYA